MNPFEIKQNKVNLMERVRSDLDGINIGESKPVELSDATNYQITLAIHRVSNQWGVKFKTKMDTTDKSKKWVLRVE